MEEICIYQDKSDIYLLTNILEENLAYVHLYVYISIFLKTVQHFCN